MKLTPPDWLNYEINMTLKPFARFTFVIAIIFLVSGGALLTAVFFDAAPDWVRNSVRPHQTLVAGIYGGISAVVTAVALVLGAVFPISQKYVDENRKRSEARAADACDLLTASQELWREVVRANKQHENGQEPDPIVVPKVLRNREVVTLQPLEIQVRISALILDVITLHDLFRGFLDDDPAGSRLQHRNRIARENSDALSNCLRIIIRAKFAETGEEQWYDQFNKSRLPKENEIQTITTSPNMGTLNT